MSKCGNCMLRSNASGRLFCEENLEYTQCINKLQDALYEISSASYKTDFDSGYEKAKKERRNNGE